VFRLCVSCGRRNPRDAETCAACGVPLTALVGRTTLHVPGRRERSLAFLSRNRAWVLGAAGGLATLVVIAVILALAGGGEPAAQAGETGAPAAAQATGDGAPSAPAEQAQPPGEREAPGALAGPVGAAVREAGFEPTLLSGFAQRAMGPEDAVLLGVQGVDQGTFRRLLGAVLPVFQELEGGGGEPPLDRLSMVLTDTRGVVHKHEVYRANALEVMTSGGGAEEMAGRLGVMVYPEAAGPPAGEGKPLDRAPGTPAAGPGPGEAPAPEASAAGIPPREEAAPQAPEAPEIRFRPVHAAPAVLKLLVETRFRDVEVSDQQGEIVVRGSQATLRNVQLYMKEVDGRSAD